MWGFLEYKVSKWVGFGSDNPFGKSRFGPLLLSVYLYQKNPLFVLGKLGKPQNNHGNKKKLELFFKHK
ncbi:MAG: hypothetical protein CM15mP28_3900 [Pseudomonadota bacterium]|nr:MAG: hypothetical protein CM15mP28_3900 [Pseudomonadota bacterium]